MRFFAGSAGVPDNEVEVQQNVARRKFRIPQPLQHRRDSCHAHSGAGLMNGGQRNRQEAGVFDVIDAHHTDFVRHADAEFIQSFQQVRRREIVRANETIRTDFVESGFDLYLVVRLDAADVGLKLRVGSEDSLAITGNACIYRRSGTGTAQKNQPAAAAPQQVRGDRITGSTIVDSNQIVRAAIRICHQVPVQQNHGDPGLVERVRDAAVDGVLLRGQFKRCKEYARDFFRDQLP